ncbi:hypothetical protein Tco_1347887 [Tanacetum coccineum]
MTIKKVAQSKTSSVPDPNLDIKSNSSTEQLFFTLMKEVKGLKEQIQPSSGNSSSVSQTGSSKFGKQTAKIKPCKHREHREQGVVKRTLNQLKAQRPHATSSRKALKIPKPFAP